MSEIKVNPPGQKTAWWTLYEYKFTPLGVCENYVDADAKADEKYVGNLWVIDHPSMQSMFAQISETLTDLPPIVSNDYSHWWAFDDGYFKRLGKLQGFDAASDKADDIYPRHVWILDLDALKEVQTQIAEELGYGATPENIK